MKPIRSKCTLIEKGFWTKQKISQRIFFSSWRFWRCFRMEGLVVEFFAKVDDDAWTSSLMQWGWYYHLQNQSWAKSLKKFAKSILNKKREELYQIGREHKAWRTLPNQSWTKSLRNFAKWALNKTLRKFAKWILNTKNLRNFAKWVLNQKLKKLTKMSPEQNLERNFAKWVLNIKKLEKLCKNRSWTKVGEICQMTPEQKLEFFFKMSLVQKAWETFPMEPTFHITAENAWRGKMEMQQWLEKHHWQN